MGNDGALDADELVPAPGGEWWGVLFDNPAVGLSPRITWGFTLPFADVSRPYGRTPVSLDIEWLPCPSVSWRQMAGQRLTNSQFGRPAEASVYFFEHHRYDWIDLRLLEQRDLTLHVAATVSGDLDGLGIDTVRTEAWLTFTGISVALHDRISPDAGLERLRAYTDTTRLRLASDQSAVFRFAPVPG